MASWIEHVEKWQTTEKRRIMRHFYVTFGDLLIDYHLHVVAKDESIVRAFMARKSKLGGWCRVVTEKPTDTHPLTSEAVLLYYEAAEHI